ncbi:MAG: hypothetical protein EXX96DRAFT_620525 [Benjaminiella poitrasii]|nr:MAG: hypothetical protein EXX96DRAFT_620525 [Benjaminiella poitrasii]
MDFEPTAFEFARGIPSKYWAEKCYILDKSTIAKATKVTPLPAMMALTYFFSSQKLSPLSSEFQDDPTIQKLYSIAKDQTSTRIPAEKSVAEVLLEVCEQTNKQFKKISNTLEPMPDTLLKKRLRAYASDGLLYTETCKRMCIRESDSLVESMPLPPELSELAKSLINESSSSIDILRAEADLPKTDMEYVQQFKESEEKMDWKKCFEGGKKEVKKERRSYITKNEAKVVNLINLLQEFEDMSISETSRKVGLFKSTAARKLKQWNQMTSEIAEKGFPDSIAIKEGKGRPAILKDEHTVFIFELLANEPTLTVEAVTDHLSKEFRDIDQSIIF